MLLTSLSLQDELSHHALNSGFRLPMAVQDEVCVCSASG